MVKLFGPALSLDATGKVGDSMVFSKWKGRAYLRKHTLPKNPKSDLQIAFRQMLTFLGNYWSEMTAIPRDSFNDLAAAAAISPYNAYIGYNQDRWRNYWAPATKWPATEGGTVGTYTAGQPTATGGRNHVTITHTIDAAIGNNWGIAIFRGETGFTPSVANCRVINQATAFNTQYTWDDTRLAPGTYYYNTRLLNLRGLWGPVLGEISAAAT